MKTKSTLLVAGAVLALLSIQAAAQPRPTRQSERNLAADSSTEEALLLALAGPDGEYAAYAEYEAIIAKHGSVQPYASILASEERHIAALKRHMEMRGLVVPPNPYSGRIEVPATLLESARSNAEAERRNVALYDSLIEKVKDQPDLMRVFTHLQSASRDCHLPAFVAAAAAGGQSESAPEFCGKGRGGSGGMGKQAQGAQGGMCMGSCKGFGTSEAGSGLQGAGKRARNGHGWQTR